MTSPHPRLGSPLSRSTGRAIALAAAGLSAALVLTACGSSGGDGDSSSGKTDLALVAYSVPQPGFNAVIDGFEHSDAGKGAAVSASYGPSGDQSRKVTQGLAADVVNFSVEPDMTRLVKAGLVSKDWNQGQYHGIPFGSVVSLVVRKGNPKNIHDWSDLLKPGVEVISPDPLSSGSAKWNLLAPYAAASNGGKNPQAGIDFVSRLVKDHIKSRPASGRDATDLFLQGSGDVLISYENEAINTIRQGAAVDYVDPPVNFKIQNPFAVVAKSSHQEQAKAFNDFQYSTAGQQLWAKAGFRPVDPQVAAQYADVFPDPAKLWTIDDLGGWSKIDSELFDKSDGKITVIYRAATG